MKTMVRTIDSLSEWTGKIMSWFCVVLVAIMTYEVIMRYVFNAPTKWVYETSQMVGTLIYIMAWSYVHKHNAHIRVDVIHSHLTLKGKATVDLLGDVFFFCHFWGQSHHKRTGNRFKEMRTIPSSSLP